MSGAAAARPLRAVVVPEWLAEVVRPRRAPVPWPEMARAALAICVPLSVSFAAGRPTLGVLPAMGGLLGTMADAGGPYRGRVERVGGAAVIALEQVMDAITATALAVSRGARVSRSGVRQLCDALRAVSEAAATGSALAGAPELPDDETLKPVTDAVRALLGVLGTGERLSV